MSSRTRKHGGNNRPRAVLFEGPPGCGKTTSARWTPSCALPPLLVGRLVVLCMQALPPADAAVDAVPFLSWEKDFLSIIAAIPAML